MKAVRSIRSKLILSYVLLSISTACAVGFISYGLIARFVNRRIDEELLLAAEEVEREIRPLFRSESVDEIRIITDAFSMFNDARIRVFDLRRQLITDTHPGGADRSTTELSLATKDLQDAMVRIRRGVSGRMHIELGEMRHRFQLERPTPEPPTATKDGTADFDRLIRTSGGRTITVPVRDAGGLVGYVEFQNRPELVETTLGRSRLFLGIAAILATAAAIAVGLVMGRRLTSPIIGVGAAVSSMAEGDLTVRAEVNRNDELGVLARQVNRMADRIEHSIDMLREERDSLKAFAADASHELRNPVTALRTFNELLRGRTGLDPEKRNEFLTDSIQQLDRLEWIVEALLELTRLDSGTVGLELSPHDLSEIVGEVLPTFNGRLEAKTMSLEIASPQGPCVVECDKRAIATVVSNLIDNAIKFSSPGTKIVVSCGDSGRSTYLSVEDEGDGIREIDRPHVFKRFYRARGAQEEGSGLGLSIVESIVKAHGGTVEIAQGRRVGTAVTVRFPREDDPSPAE